MIALIDHNGLRDERHPARKRESLKGFHREHRGVSRASGVRSIELLNEAAALQKKFSNQCITPGVAQFRAALTSFISVICGYSNCREKAKRPLMPTRALCAESVNILTAAPIN